MAASFPLCASFIELDLCLEKLMEISFEQNDRYGSSVLEQVVISAPSPPLATGPAAISNSASVSPDLTGWTVKRRRWTLRDESAPSQQRKGNPKTVGGNRSNSSTLTPVTVARPALANAKGGKTTSVRRKKSAVKSHGTVSTHASLHDKASAANRHFTQSRAIFEALMNDSGEETKCEASDTEDLVPQPPMVSSLRNHLSSSGATERGEIPQDNLLLQRDIDIDMDDMDELQIDSGSDMAISDNGVTSNNRGDDAHQYSEEQSSQEIRIIHDTLLELEDEKMEITPKT
ncbi:unnamed protein product [Peronospora destructor]|uniref:Uncharacterized protein n=1 Tax=Peronospora destructor TaxID=86335 RepID=A0AAV0VDH4_9STRA|nr:unnamed protein product [Peronospora destructor]